MPELPEVETVRKGLAGTVAGYTIRDVEILDKRSLKRNIGSISSFRKELVGSKLEQFKRRGKFLWTPLGGNLCLVAHLGMSGQILVRTPDYPQDKCERIKIAVSQANSNLEVRFIDQRLFGGMSVDELVDQGSKGKVPLSVQHIALDPLDKEFDIEDVTLKISKRSAGIKSLLLNQGILSGIGNIYADETLWLTKIHYLTPGNSLTRKRILQVIESAKEVLIKAVAQGGTSFDEQYKNVNGESGYFSNSLNAYGQTGLPCPRCGTPIKREAWANRGSHICPRCQKLKG